MDGAHALSAQHGAQLDGRSVDPATHDAAAQVQPAAQLSASRLSADLEAAWQRPRLAVLALPAGAEASVTLGRSRECDCVVAEPSVSRRHAELRHDGEQWLLRDLGSRATAPA